MASGNRANSPLDTPANIVTASALNSRAGDLNNLMDSMASGIKTIEQADSGLAAITQNLEAMQATCVRPARMLPRTTAPSWPTSINDLLGQLDKLADGAAFNGINLLRGDNLTIAFNETGTSTIDIQTKDGASIDTANLGLGVSPAARAISIATTAVDAKLDAIRLALGAVRSQASAFGSNLSIVQSRSDFTRNMINTLQTGAAKLTLADSNEEAANLLALQTRQSLSSLNLSMASQSDQSVLQLLR